MFLYRKIIFFLKIAQQLHDGKYSLKLSLIFSRRDISKQILLMNIQNSEIYFLRVHQGDYKND